MSLMSPAVFVFHRCAFHWVQSSFVFGWSPIPRVRSAQLDENPAPEGSVAEKRYLLAGSTGEPGLSSKLSSAKGTGWVMRLRFACKN